MANANTLNLEEEEADDFAIFIGDQWLRQIIGLPPRRIAAAHPEEIRQRIAQKAYEIYQRRGRRDGHDLEDWLEAERIVSKVLESKRKA
jgi:hypothetical protein